MLSYLRDGEEVVDAMNKQMKSVRVSFLIFLLLEALCCQGCWTEERQALLDLRSRFDYPFSWNVHTDCCEWEGVYCNSSTGRVAQLDLYDVWNSDEQYINYSDFSVFKDLKNLSLSFSNIVGCVRDAELPNLQLLDMMGNNLDAAASIISCLNGLPSLKYLYLIDNRLNTSSLKHAFESLSPKLRNLEVLNIRGNYLTNDILPSLEGFTSLKELYLGRNELDSDLHFEDLWSKLRNVEVLDLSSNNFSHTDIGSALSGLSSLNSLDLGYSGLSWRSIYNISKLSSLEVLDLGWNHLNESGSMLSFKENETFKWPTNLQHLNLENNSLSNIFLSSLKSVPRLQYLHLSSNQLQGAVDISGLKGLTRLDVLRLDGNMIDGNKLRESLRALSSSIRELSISYNNFKGTILAEDFHDLSNLERLTLDGNNNMENEFFESIGNLTFLKTLSLSYCHINDTLPAADWSKMKKLEELNLIDNGFEGFLPNSFVNMTSLRILEISQNNFIGKFDSSIATLTSLEHFGFTENQFELPVSFFPFANHSNLKVILGEGNKIILDSQHNLHTWIPKFQLSMLSLSSNIETSSFQLPKFLLYQKDLIRLDFSNLNLEGRFPHWLLENNTKLFEVITFINCSLTGTMKLPLRPLLELWRIDVSNNIIIGEIPSKNISSIYPNLEYVNMSRNHFQGSIPRELGQMKLLSELDLSNNQLSGEISNDIFEAGQELIILILSNNKLEGPIFTIPTNLESLSLNDNNFGGKLPSNIFNTSILSLDVSNNHLVGNISSLLTKFSRLSELRMSNNHFEGFIPSELGQLEDLRYLDLSQNNLIGLIPSFLNSSVKFIHLSNNHLTGLSKKMFNENSPIVMLDLSYNEISGNIQDMTQDLSYTKLNFFLLKGNHINGGIPKQLCQLIALTMLDLSDNKFSGEIPHCLGTMPFDNKNLDPLLKASKGSFIDEEYASQAPLPSSEHKKEKASFTSKRSTYTYTGSILGYMSGIDLSLNKLKGNIPSELGNLTRIRALNLSHNDLIGQIPNSFSNLMQTESLDLSFNKLSGQIPPKLNILTSLEVLSLAHNNLSGPIPKQTNQFATFDESSYEGNPFLCGPPLLKSCNPSSTIFPNDLSIDKENLVDMYVFCVSFVVSYTLALLATIGALYINPYWRQAWFYYMELVTLNSYYYVVDNFCRFCNVRNM